MVEKGQLLFTIDSREYRAAADAAGADASRAEARVALAKQELQRDEKLIGERAISQGELDQSRMEAQQAEADVLAARANQAQANLNLGFTRVTAPFAGRAGRGAGQAGQRRRAERVPADDAGVRRSRVRHVRRRRARLPPLPGASRATAMPKARATTRKPVLIGLANEEGFPHKGEVDFVDNALNPATGTIRARAVVPNPDGRFTPGLFARVRLLGESQSSALLIHEQAVLTDQDRRYVYVVGKDNAAERRDVTLGPPVEGLRVVETGLKAGDKVIVNGMRKIFFPGQPVNPHVVPMDQPNLPTPGAGGAGGGEVTPWPSTPTSRGSSSTVRSSRRCCRR